MSIAIINASVGGLLTVAGTTTLSGALTSASTLNTQGMTTTGLTVNGNSTTSGQATIGSLNATTISVSGTLNSLTTTHLNNIGTTTSNVQTQLNKISINNVLNLSTGIKNLGLGDYNLPALTTGSFNTGIGTDTLSQTVSGSYNIAIGDLAGGGVLGSNNICIGRFSGSDPYVPTNFTNSICIGLDSKMLASNQIVLGTNLHTTKIDGKLDVSGNMSLSNNALFLKQPTDGNHTLVYDATSNGPALKGFAGGRLGTGVKGDILTWNTTGAVHSVAINGITQCGGNVALNDNALYLRGSTDAFHTVRYNLTSDGPALQGNGGGRIGTATKGDILTWNSTAGLHSVAVNGNLSLTNNLVAGATTITNTSLGFLSGATSNIQTQFTNNSTQLSSINGNINTLQNNTVNIQWNGTATTINGIARHGGVLALANNPLYLKDYTDSNHTLVYDATSDGPALKGFNGGRLGNVTKGDIMTWTTSGGVHSTTVNGDNYVVGKAVATGAIIETITGHYVNFYRKAGCATTETFNFQPFHGLYEVFYSLNHDRTTTCFVYVDVVNNVNGGSYVTAVTQGSGITTSINTTTNVFTLTSSFANGLLIINRKMAYP